MDDSADRAQGMPAGLLTVLTLMVFVVMMDGRVMIAMLPDIASDLDSTVSAAGLALTAYLCAYGALQLVYGPISDRVGAVRVMSWAVVAFAAVLGLTAAVPDLRDLIAVRLLAGALAAAFFPLALATVGTLVPYESRQQAVATLLASVALGQVLGAAIAGIVAEAISWRAMFVLDAALAAAMIVPIWRWRASVPASARYDDPLAGYRRLLRSRRALSLYALLLLEGGAFFGGTGYLGAFLHDEYGVSLAGVGLILALEGAAIFLASRTIARLRARLGEDRLILTGGTVMGAAFLFILATGSWQAVVPAAVALGAGFALCHSTLQTRATSLDAHAPASAISLFVFSLFAGSALGTALLGRLLASSGYDAILLASGIGLLVVAAVAPRSTAAPSPAPA